jgi:hypothetical protein
MQETAKTLRPPTNDLPGLRIQLVSMKVNYLINSIIYVGDDYDDCNDGDGAGVITW